ncbi:glycoside hydrolase [Meredithblackwellia eburnea MCA 4105]
MAHAKQPDGSACNQSALVLEAIRQTKVNMTVWLGAYIGDNKTVNAQQQQVTLDVLRTYGTDHVEGVIIGNEYILNAESQSTAITYIINQVAAFKTQLAALNLAKTLPVGTADAGSVLTATLAKGVDFFMANVHPFFGGVPIAQGAAWTNEFFQENDVYYCNRAANSPTCYIAETGWPTASLTPANLTIGGATAGVAQLQTFLDTFVCQANANGTEYFYFEAFDEPWKVSFGGVEPFWGLMDSNKKMKAITIPSC